MDITKLAFIALGLWSVFDAYNNFSVQLDTSMLLIVRFLSLGGALSRFIGCLSGLHYVEEKTKNSENKSHVQTMFFFNLVLAVGLYMIWGNHLE